MYTSTQRSESYSSKKRFVKRSNVPFLISLFFSSATAKWFSDRTRLQKPSLAQKRV